MRSQTHVRGAGKKLIHPTAIVSERAELAAGVRVGPYTVIGEDVRIGAGSIIGPHCVIEKGTQTGRDTRVYAGSVLGGEPQIAGFNPETHSRLVIGDGNVIREFVTIHRGGKEGSATILGDRNYIMTQCHVAHDCRIGSQVTLTNLVQLSGHVTIGDRAVVGGMTGIHQFVRIGAYAMVGGFSRVIRDIPPYSLSEGRPVRIAGVNAVGLKRAGFKESQIREIRGIYRKLFFSKRVLAEAVRNLKAAAAASPEAEHLVQFIQESKRGVAGRAPF